MKHIGVFFHFFIASLLAFAGLSTTGCKESDKSFEHALGQHETSEDREKQNRNLIDQVVQATENQENYADPAYLRGALGRLNSWLANHDFTADFEQDSEISSLFESFSNLSQTSRRANELFRMFTDESKTPAEKDGEELRKLLSELQTKTNELSAKLSSNALKAYSLFFSDITQQLTTAKNSQFADVRETYRAKIQEFINKPACQYYNFNSFIEGIESFQRLLVLDGKTYLPQDADYLRQTVWFRDIFSWAKGDKQDDLTIVKKLFDWSVINVIITPLTSGPSGPMSQQPWQTLLLSQGSAMDRALVFMELLRQHRLDAFIIRPSGEKREKFPLVVGVRLNGEVYLFLPEYGFPIPSSSSDALSLDQGLQFNKIATLNEVANDDSLLRKLDLEGIPFPAKSKDFESVTAYLPATPFTSAARMIPLEQEFSSSINTVLSTGYESQKERVAGMAHISNVQHLFEATAPILEQTLFDFESDELTAIYMIAMTSHGSLEVLDSDDQTSDKATAIDDYTGNNTSTTDSPSVSSGEKKVQNASLWIGKNLYIRGQFVDDNGASRHFLQGRISDRVIKKEEAAIPQQVRDYLSKYTEYCTSQNKTPTQEELQAIANEMYVSLQVDITTKRYVKILTSYYLALLSEACGNDAAALEHLNDNALRIRPQTNSNGLTYGEIWRYAGNYLQALILERQGKIEAAVARLQIDPINIGAHIRANWLVKLSGISPVSTPSEETLDSPENQTIEQSDEETLPDESDNSIMESTDTEVDSESVEASVPTPEIEKFSEQGESVVDTDAKQSSPQAAVEADKTESEEVSQQVAKPGEIESQEVSQQVVKSDETESQEVSPQD